MTLNFDAHELDIPCSSCGQRAGERVTLHRGPPRG